MMRWTRTKSYKNGQENMKAKFEFGQNVLVLPGRVLSMLHTAKDSDIKVLLALSSGEDLTVASLAEMAGCTVHGAEAAMRFWEKNGVLVGADEVSIPHDEAEAIPAQTAAAKPATKGKPSRHDKLPQYTTDELTELLEKRQETAAFLDECQQIWGKMFNTHEVNIILGLVDYLGLEWEYVLSLLAYCQGLQSKRGVRRSLHYVETLAFGFYDEGICTVQALYDKLRQLERMAEVEGQLRTLFGMGDRALTPQEKKYFSTWIHEFGYDLDVIRRGYEITVDTKGSPKMSYMNSVLANWNRDGLRTLEQVDEAQAAFDKAKESKRTGKDTASQKSGEACGSTFDTDDFFEAAVRRSLGADFDPSILKN